MSNKIMPYFSEILNDSMFQETKANRRLVEGLSDTVQCSMRNIQRYRTGEQVPDYIVAKAILDFLGIDINEDELSEILFQSKLRSKEMRKLQKTPTKLLYINSTNIDLGIDIGSAGIDELINNRVLELYGDKGTIKNYIEDLIQKDLNDRIL